MHLLTEEFKKQLEEALFSISLPRNHFLLVEGQRPPYAYFLERGLLISFTYRHGHKTIARLWEEGSILFFYKSFFYQAPARENIQLLEDSSFLCITNEHMRRLFDAYPLLSNILSRAVIMGYSGHYEERVVDLLSKPVRERYLDLLKAHPGIEQKVSQKTIAEYLGIIPSSFSRLKKRIDREDTSSHHN